MIMLLSESSRYLPYFEKEAGLKFEKKIEATPFGEVQLWESSNILFVENMGRAPMAIAYILEEYNVRFLCMVSKVGGINNLLSVGDVMIIEDYIDNTTSRQKSYVEATKKEIKIRYDMAEPFCGRWKENFTKEFNKNIVQEGFNFFTNGTYICTDGPGFESDGEIRQFRLMGADVVGHWISPFVYYARELNICFVSVGIVSNVYKKDNVTMTDADETNRLFGRVYKMLLDSHPDENCTCQTRHILQYEMY